ncbi:MAG: helix-turn-helix domain-containing protein [Synergistaceae bacterium]|nr:helix-turn-helix domain-containing protein [Synergistaceae bacterium]
MLKKGMNAEKTKYLIIERKVIKMVATVATRLEIRGGFYFTQPDNVVMFDETLSQTAKVVYCNLLSHVKKGTNRCKLYISTIAEEVKRSVRTVRRALSQLCERGVIVRLMQYGNKQNQLASLFVIIGKNAACYQDSSQKFVVERTNQAEVNTEKADTVNDATVEADTEQVLPSTSGTKMASPCEIKAATKVRTESETRSVTKTVSKAETKTASLPKVSAPHAKNGRQNNNKGDNKNLLKDTLIGQAELPKSLSSSSLRKQIKNDHKTAQILIDFDAQETQEIEEIQEISGQKECLTDLPVVERPHESDENNADEHSNREILGETGSKIADSESVIELESESEDLTLPEEVECSDADSIDGVNSIDSNSTFDPLACVQNAERIPNDMSDTARYFLYRTGRDPRTINEKEIQAMREVFAKHYPARIQKEIDVACRRFFKNGKSLKVLFFGYIAAALRKQQSLVPFDRIAQKTFSKTAEKLAKQEEDGNIKASSGQETPQLREVSGGHRYLTSEDISDKTNPLSSMSMEELLALEKELDGKMKKL